MNPVAWRRTMAAKGRELLLWGRRPMSVFRCSVKRKIMGVRETHTCYYFFHSRDFTFDTRLKRRHGRTFLISNANVVTGEQFTESKFCTCIGLLWLSTLSMPSTGCCGPPKNAVRTLKPTDKRFAQGLAGAVSSISFLLGLVSPVVCPSNICISMLSIFDQEKPVLPPS